MTTTVRRLPTVTHAKESWWKVTARWYVPNSAVTDGQTGEQAQGGWVRRTSVLVRAETMADALEATKRFEELQHCTNLSAVRLHDGDTSLIILSDSVSC